MSTDLKSRVHLLLTKGKAKERGISRNAQEVLALPGKTGKGLPTHALRVPGEAIWGNM